MQIGRLNRRVVIQYLVDGQDEAGQPVQNWLPLATVWADIRHLSGVESIKAGGEASVVKASIRIRWRTDVTPAMRVVHGSTVYQIKAVLPDEESHERVDLLCEVIA
jgi:SPP1 family predicted phage head-tail adaptor